MSELNKTKILIVDDDNFLLDMYALKFTESGFEVIPSSGGEDALDKIRGGLEPDIMLLDVVMPKIDGFELMQTLNKEKLCMNATKVVLSNRGQPSDIEAGNTLGAAGYIVKASATPSEVVSKVKDIVAGANRK